MQRIVSICIIYYLFAYSIYLDDLDDNLVVAQ